MRDHKGCIRGYHRISKSYYSKNYQFPVVSFGMYDPEGGTSGEMSMEWTDLGRKKSARLMCFEDAFSALSLFSDSIHKLQEYDSKDIQEEEYCKILDSLGFKDLTQYEDPNKNENEELITIKIPKYQAERLGLI